jgi:hypothetical protein
MATTPTPGGRDIRCGSGNHDFDDDDRTTGTVVARLLRDLDTIIQNCSDIAVIASVVWCQPGRIR